MSKIRGGKATSVRSIFSLSFFVICLFSRPQWDAPPTRTLAACGGHHPVGLGGGGSLKRGSDTQTHTNNNLLAPPVLASCSQVTGGCSELLRGARVALVKNHRHVPQAGFCHSRAYRPEFFLGVGQFPSPLWILSILLLFKCTVIFQVVICL